MVSLWNIEKMKQAREDMELTVKAASTALNITPEYLSMLENGHKQPSQKLILRMSSLYKKPVNYFLEAEKNLIST